jgi:hypothetical protein
LGLDQILCGGEEQRQVTTDQVGDGLRIAFVGDVTKLQIGWRAKRTAKKCGGDPAAGVP